jgi:hypothetical protein
MRRAAIILFAALFVALPVLTHAQYNDTDTQNPKEYTDDDSNPLALFADVLYPVGFAVEWMVARPAHWVATDSPASPLYRPVGGNDRSPAPLVPIIPDNTMDQASTSTTPQDWSPTRGPVTTNATTVKQRVPAAAASTSSSQPALSQPALH